MRVRRAVFPALLAALVLAGGGCSDNPSFPADLAGSFALSTANGQPLPYTLPGTPAGTTVTLLSGDLVILANGHFDEQLRFHLVTPDNPGGSNTLSQTIGTARVNGGNITFSARFEDSFGGSINATGVTYTKLANAVSIAFAFTRHG